jgi:hypothetical protein
MMKEDTEFQRKYLNTLKMLESVKKRKKELEELAKEKGFKIPKIE